MAVAAGPLLCGGATANVSVNDSLYAVPAGSVYETFTSSVAMLLPARLLLEVSGWKKRAVWPKLSVPTARTPPVTRGTKSPEGNVATMFVALPYPALSSVISKSKSTPNGISSELAP